jgi:hypothetical protein
MIVEFCLELCFARARVKAVTQPSDVQPLICALFSLCKSIAALMPLAIQTDVSRDRNRLLCFL